MKLEGNCFPLSIVPVSAHNTKLLVSRDHSLQVTTANFSKFRGPVCKILLLAAANFPHIAINFIYGPLNPTKYAVFVAGNPAIDRHSLSMKQTGNISNKTNIFNILPVRAQVAVIYFTVQSCLHTLVNFLWPPEPDQNMPYLSPYHCHVPNSQHSAKTQKFRRNGQIITHSAESCGPYCH